MNVSISNAIFKLFPEIQVFGLLIDLSGSLPDVMDFPKSSEIDGDLFLNEISIWNDIYKKFPRPKGARVSIKYLFNCFVKDKKLNINPIVDSYNIASISSMCPIGGEDFDLLSELKLDTSTGDEKFIDISQNFDKTLPGEVVWRCFDNIVCRSMNYIESDLFKITNSTNRVLFLIEKPVPHLNGDPLKAISLLKAQLKGVTLNEFVLNNEQPSIEL